jgi:hypothetical protein
VIPVIGLLRKSCVDDLQCHRGSLDDGGAEWWYTPEFSENDLFII